MAIAQTEQFCANTTPPYSDVEENQPIDCVPERISSQRGEVENRFDGTGLLLTQK